MDAIREAIYEVLRDQHPATVRGTFYQLVSNGVIPKKESEYKATVVRLLGEMRREGVIPYTWVADNTRWMRKPVSYSSMEEMLRITAQTYRRSLWNDQDHYIEVWLEKDALSGVVYDVTASFDVPLMVTRGYPSVSYLAVAAEVIEEQGKPTFIYYLGDLDPSGVDIPRFTESELRRMAPGADISFERLAVLPQQVEEFHLPTRPTKRTDTRSKSFAGESVEVDAIPAPTLRRMVEDAIVAHIDPRTWNHILKVETAERESLANFAARWPA